MIKTHGNNQVKETLMVTIRCTAYNHGNYIRECLDGFVKQKTNFRFEAIVHDDASTDNTASIIREYAAKYPNIIKPIYEIENQFSKHNGAISKIMNDHTFGKYVALCEGDDFWTDAYKLQKQVDFLESHPDYMMCFHNATRHYEPLALKKAGVKVKQDQLFSNIIDRDYTGVEIYQSWMVPTASVVLRSEVFFSALYKNQIIGNKNFMCGDIVLFLACEHFGKLKGMSDVMSVYRSNINSMVYQYEKDGIYNLYRNIVHHNEIYSVFGDKYKTATQKFIIDNAFKLYIESRFKDGEYFKKYLKEFPIFTIFRCLKRIIYSLNYRLKRNI